MFENDVISLYDNEGNEVLYQVLLTFESDEFEKKYVLLVPAEIDPEDDDLEVLAYSYTETEDGEFKDLVPVESDEEWDMIEEVFYTEFGDEDDDDLDFEFDDEDDDEDIDDNEDEE
ncbi:MAG TPA: DUF1292 domain-containing protein [Haloplasmataceae bacterium]